MAKADEKPEAADSGGGEQTQKSADAGKGESGGQTQVVEEVDKSARKWAVACHLAGLAWLIWWIVPAIGGILGPLIFWQVKKDEHSFVDEHGKEAFNFQISMLIYAVVSAVFCFACIGFVLLPAVMVRGNSGVISERTQSVATFKLSDSRRNWAASSFSEPSEAPVF